MIFPIPDSGLPTGRLPLHGHRKLRYQVDDAALHSLPSSHRGGLRLLRRRGEGPSKYFGVELLEFLPMTSCLESSSLCDGHNDDNDDGAAASAAAAGDGGADVDAEARRLCVTRVSCETFFYSSLLRSLIHRIRNCVVPVSEHGVCLDDTR